jgi:Mrp family chromosome partitioning ATPase
MLGIVALVLYDQWRGQVDTAGQLERLLNLPVLSTVSAPPTSPDATPGSVTAIRADNAYHDLEIALSYLRIERPLRTVALTSVGTEDAKQAVAEEMALAAARLGKKALLVQADLTAATGGASASDGLPGLSEAIADYQSPLTPADAINAYIQAPGGAMPRSLRLLPAGTPPPHPARLLATPAADRAFMGIIASDAEAIIIVAPPLLDYEGAKGVCTHADGALLVITLGVVRWQDVLEARRRLLDDGAHLLGCVAVQGSPA